MNKLILISILLFIISASVSAETDLAAIEAQERAKIISELSYSLETNQNCTAILNWDDSGSGADKDGYFFLPEVNNNEYIIGGHASGKRRSKFHCVTTVSPAKNNPEGAPNLLVKPVDWKQVWKDSGSGATKDGSFWQALPPDNNYVCIGSVSQLSHNTKPNIPNYRCVHKSLTEKIVLSGAVWSDKGSGSDQQVSIFSLPTTGIFLAVSPRASKVEAYDLKKNASNVPDEKQVEEILAIRMAPLKADIQSQAEAQAEEQAKALEEEKARKIEAQKVAAKKAEAEKAEQERLAAAEEKKKQEKARQKELAAQKLREEEQTRIAKVEKETVEEAKQKEVIEKETQVKQEQQIQAEQVNNNEDKPEPKTEAELEIEKESEAAVSESVSTDDSENESKGLNDILMFFLKIFGMMVGGVIIFMIAFKVIFGGKKE